jgi:hypothetical protein
MVIIQAERQETRVADVMRARRARPWAGQGE